VNREDWVLLAVYFGHERGLSPVQLQKSLFLLGQEMQNEVGNFYKFIPHNYGPFAREVYTDADVLAERALIAIEQDASSYARYLITAVGRDRVRENLVRDVSNRAQEYLGSVVEWAQKQTFSGLVKAIYAKYPEYRINSVFHRRRKGDHGVSVGCGNIADIGAVRSLQDRLYRALLAGNIQLRKCNVPSGRDRCQVLGSCPASRTPKHTSGQQQDTRWAATKTNKPVDADRKDGQHYETKGLAEREGFDYRRYLQVIVKTRHSDNILCLRGFQAHFQLPVHCLPRPLMTSVDHRNGITGITFWTWKLPCARRAYLAIRAVFTQARHPATTWR
jgi:uncharacterized protein